MTQVQAPDAGTPPLHEAIQRLITILDGLDAFEPCRGPVENWPEEIRHRRAPVWDLWPVDWQQRWGQQFKETWSAYGGGCLLTCFPRMVAPQSVRGLDYESASRRAAIARVTAARARLVPEHIAQMLGQCWNSILFSRPTPELIVRNDWHERREFVARLRPEIGQLVPVAKRAVTRVGGELLPLDALTEDALLHDETVDRAITQLNRAWSWCVPAAQRGAGSQIAIPATADGESGPTDEGRPAEQADRLVTVEEAALALRKPERTIRNWIKKGGELQPVDRLGGPRKAAARYRLGDISARRPDRT